MMPAYATPFLKKEDRLSAKLFIILSLLNIQICFELRISLNLFRATDVPTLWNHRRCLFLLIYKKLYGRNYREKVIFMSPLWVYLSLGIAALVSIYRLLSPATLLSREATWMSPIVSYQIIKREC